MTNQLDTGAQPPLAMTNQLDLGTRSLLT